MKGGERAAHTFRQHIETLIREDDGGSDTLIHCRVMVRVYVNFTGLSGALIRKGIIASSNDLCLFANGFTSSEPLFDFVDVGSTKEVADYKIRGMVLRLLVRRPLICFRNRTVRIICG